MNARSCRRQAIARRGCSRRDPTDRGGGL